MSVSTPLCASPSPSLSSVAKRYTLVYQHRFLFHNFPGSNFTISRTRVVAPRDKINSRRPSGRDGEEGEEENSFRASPTCPSDDR